VLASHPPQPNHRNEHQPPHQGADDPLLPDMSLGAVPVIPTPPPGTTT